jgi:regulator of replication initiation timing
VTGSSGESPIERLARWADADAAIGVVAEAEQLRAQLAERVAEIDDLRARLGQLVSRVAQVEADNAELRRAASRMSLGSLARRVYRRARSAAASRLPR